MKIWGDITFDYSTQGICRMYIPKFSITLIAKTESKLASEREGTVQSSTGESEGRTSIPPEIPVEPRARASIPPRLYDLNNVSSGSDNESDPDMAEEIRRAKQISLLDISSPTDPTESAMRRAHSETFIVEASGEPEAIAEIA
jgi:hypothetical protein